MTGPSAAALLADRLPSPWSYDTARCGDGCPRCVVWKLRCYRRRQPWRAGRVDHDARVRAVPRWFPKWRCRLSRSGDRHVVRYRWRPASGAVSCRQPKGALQVSKGIVVDTGHRSPTLVLDGRSDIKRRRRSRAGIARHLGLLPLAAVFALPIYLCVVVASHSASDPPSCHSESWSP